MEFKHFPWFYQLVFAYVLIILGEWVNCRVLLNLYVNKKIVILIRKTGVL